MVESDNVIGYSYADCVESKLFTDHLSFVVSSHNKDTFGSDPRSTSIPAFSVAEPLALLFKTMILSARVIVSVLIVVLVPLTVKLPSITKFLITPVPISLLESVKTTIPVAFGNVMVLSAVGSVTVKVVSNPSSDEPSNIISEAVYALSLLVFLPR